ncbi:PrpF family protein [Pigmentiphaga sp. GD03639]|uniref:2-methylaconitate cis-trans isomerase PrpF n=1 Tax=Pigmentiphaga daeguensis TaxID=414049 RepID=A0ABN1CPY4_9BURK|nr:PrpF domain-containing protein [Pigmentiphaga sp. GD03639]MDH2236610.1 PrpF family protein [Pigmentiphaga sp. GD03639]
MRQYRLPAVFMRGGTSKGLMLHRRDLPPDRRAWAPLFLAAMGSPDPFGRQLDGMGGGLSSLSKVCVIGPSSRSDADVDYTFAQVQIKSAHVDFRPNCGNMSSAVGPFAVDEGLVRVQGDEAVVRIHNTNTGKIIVARFGMDEGLAAVEGGLAIPGVAGTGAPLHLDFLDPAGATTGRLLPTGNVADMLEIPGFGPVRASMVDASNACVFVRAADLGLLGDEAPAAIEADARLMARLQAIRVAASIRMGVAVDEAAATASTAVPFVAFVAPCADGSAADFQARVLSNGQAHRALPLGVSVCLATAARLEGSVVHGVCGAVHGRDLRIAMPSGVLPVTAVVHRDADGAWNVERGGFYRTQRRLFEGTLLLRHPPPA